MLIASGRARWGDSRAQGVTVAGLALGRGTSHPYSASRLALNQIGLLCRLLMFVRFQARGQAWGLGETTNSAVATTLGVLVVSIASVFGTPSTGRDDPLGSTSLAVAAGLHAVFVCFARGRALGCVAGPVVGQRVCLGAFSWTMVLALTSSTCGLPLRRSRVAALGVLLEKRVVGCGEIGKRNIVAAAANGQLGDGELSYAGALDQHGDVDRKTGATQERCVGGGE